ncbi:MAG: hypothetical protein WC655_26225 [Candidatus Hydrogenedentales bacterium]|jgi:hypothetical protein
MYASILYALLVVNLHPIIELEQTLDAIRLVESSGGRDTRDGDSGRAVGPYQIHRAYWQDGTRFLGVHWPYRDARDPARARQVVRAYVVHYQRAGGYPATPEVWAETHNGGPRGPEKDSTTVYWRKIQEAKELHDASILRHVIASEMQAER